MNCRLTINSILYSDIRNGGEAALKNTFTTELLQAQLGFNRPAMRTLFFEVCDNVDTNQSDMHNGSTETSRKLQNSKLDNLPFN